MCVNFITGIQRVVREVVTRLLQKQELEIVLLSSTKGQFYFDILDNKKFLEYFVSGVGEREQIFSGKRCELKDIEAGSTFFDIDSVWNAHIRRSAILPELKKQGVKIAVYVYDIIPITYPQYCHENTTFFFMNYLGAFLQYADIIIVSAESTLRQINKLTERLGLKRKKIYVSWLGADFTAKSNQGEYVEKEVKNIVKQGRYILCIGTIEPRKNHKLLLDAYDEKLADMGINMVFAGKIGWNVEELHQRILKHPKYGKGLYHLKGLNDASIDYLYRNAYVVAFPTFEEGFGLPVIESIQRKSLLVASDIPVLREVGGEYCDYFDPNSPNSLIMLIEKYMKDPILYQTKKEKLKEYVPVTWEQVSDSVEDALMTLKNDVALKTSPIKQMVILSARIDNLLATAPFIEKYMPFIQELVICCPDKMAATLRERYDGRLKLEILTDSEILAGNKLPDDHITRNFYLRCGAMKNEKLDTVFIMGDDDYRPLKQIEEKDFYQDGKYIGYYCYDLEHWTGNVDNMTSFDIGMRKTAEFLMENKYPCKHYASHMPQIINKNIYQEMLQVHPGIESKGYCEWSTYFNYLQFKHPSAFEARIYKTMCWPGNPTDWKQEVIPDELWFENFYEENYTDNGLFAGYSQKFSNNIEQENKEKILKYLNRQEKFQKYQELFDVYSQMYNCEYHEEPQIGVLINKENSAIAMPKYLVLKNGGFVRIPFEVRVSEEIAEKDGKLAINSYYSDAHGNIFCHGETLNIVLKNCNFDFPLYGYYHEGNYRYNLEIKYGETTMSAVIPISILG